MVEASTRASSRLSPRRTNRPPSVAILASDLLEGLDGPPDAAAAAGGGVAKRLQAFETG